MNQTNKETHPGEITGRFHASGRGYGFVSPLEVSPGAGDYFIPPCRDGGAWNGDLVRISPNEDGGADGEKNTACVTGVLERANRVVIGTLERRGSDLFLVPDSSKLPSHIQIVSKARGVRAGEKAAVSVTSFGGAKRGALGSLLQTFGAAGSREAAVEAILYHYEIERDFPPAVLEAADKLPQEITDEALAGRVDLRDACIITIDGASAKDLDDAVSLERDAQGRQVLGVHIADVSHYIQEKSLLDEQALERGTSVYFADQVIPMLPVALSNGICSLHPQVSRLCLSCSMTLDKSGEVVDYRIEKTVIRTTERMTYEDCNRLLSGGDKALEETYSHILPMLREMAALSSLLEKKRRKRGSLDLEAGESYILCNGAGEPVAVERREPGVSEGLIESFMLAANECVAKHMSDAPMPSVYRVHEKPTETKLETLRAMLSPLGYDIKEGDNYQLQKLLHTVRGTPEAMMVNTMVLRSLMKARYDVQNLGHFGLAAKYYCHFTSPIRRYPDLMVHRILSAQLSGRLRGGAVKKYTTAAGSAATQSSERELAAQNAEREIERRYMAEYMAGHLEEAFPAVVSGLGKAGLFVTLDNGIEAFLPAAALPADHYQYDERSLTLSGGQGTVYSIGMLLQVVCVAADPGSGEITVILPGSGGAAPTQKKDTSRALPKETKKRTPPRRRSRSRQGRKRS